MGNQMTVVFGYLFLYFIELKERIVSKLYKDDYSDFKIPKPEDFDKDKPSKYNTINYFINRNNDNRRY